MSDDLHTDPNSGLAVIEGIELRGKVNQTDEQLFANIQHSIRLQHPQVKRQGLQQASVALVCGGPSLDDTFDELKQLVFDGAKLVTVNGSYQWCIDRNLKPSAQIVMDGRPSNKRFLDPVVPRCHYMLASQCHPETWAAVDGRENVWIWHVAGPNPEVEAALTAYYGGQWFEMAHGPVGGTTVLIRAIAILRTLGYLRFDVFGADSCFLEGRHHAYAQPENERDRPFRFSIHPTGHPELSKDFLCAPWHVKQLECFLQMIRTKGSEFLLNIHGNGLLAFALEAAADVEWSVNEQ